MAIFYRENSSETEQIYKVAQAWKEACLENDRSILWPEEQIWTQENLKRFKACFIDKPDATDSSFEEKLQIQLKGQPKQVYKLVCDFLFVYYLFPRTITYKTKIKKIETVCSWGDIKLKAEKGTLDALKNGIGGPGTSYNTRKPFEISYLAILGIKIKQLSNSKRTSILADYHKLEDFFDKVRKEVKKDYNTNVQIRHILLHLLFPEKYERIASSEQKKHIFNSFKYLLPNDGANLKQDEGLLQIRETLEAKYPGKKLDFYKSPLKEMWKGDDGTTGREIQYFWLTANPSIWSVDKIKDGSEVYYTAYNDKGNKRRIFSAFENAQPGDKIIFYESHPRKEITAIGEVTKGLHKEQEDSGQEVDAVSFCYERDIHPPIAWSQLIEVEELEGCSPIKNGAQGSLFELTAEEYETILSLEETEIQQSEEVIPTVSFEKELDVEKLYFEKKDRLLEQVQTALSNGKHIILTGPPGTGKSKLAKEICKSFGVQSAMATATSDWSTYETIGGYRPNRDGQLYFSPGLFLNCLKEETTNKPLNKWLIIDERSGNKSVAH